MGKGWKTAGKLETAKKKGALFTKLAREIAVSARMGGPDPESNTRLKLAITAARAASCPKDTIERAIKKGAGLDNESVIEECTYEGYGPHGVGIIVECQTDNKTRTVSEIRLLFKSHGGALGEPGAVSWMFDRVAHVNAKKNQVTDPEEEAIEVGANEVEIDQDPTETEISYNFYGAVADLELIRSSLVQRGWEIIAAELIYKSKNDTKLSPTQHEEVVQLLKELDEEEDSHRVYATLP
ncbi:MAG: YebC/PmpR family DNA-binding transcriptional regulator [Bdellovibrionales bacterium]|nr:YebC/PmpR family DNA-binding transcriptional regulator [Bdellovibrionales bacterium]